MYDSGSRVAMMLSGPGVAPGQVINDLTSLNDVFPTCADAAAFLAGSRLLPIGSSSFCRLILLMLSSLVRSSLRARGVVLLSSDHFDLLILSCCQRAGHGWPLRAV